MSNSEHINEEGKCYCGSLDCVGNLRVMLESSQAEVARLQELKDATFKSLMSSKVALQEVADYIQGFIDNKEWDEDELAKPFWQELGSMLGLNLELTEEVEVRILVSYYASITMPRGADVSDYATWVTVGDPELFSTEVEMDCVTFDEVEINLI